VRVPPALAMAPAARHALVAAAVCAVARFAAASPQQFLGSRGAEAEPIRAVFQRFVAGNDSLSSTAPLLRAFAAEFGGHMPAGEPYKLLVEFMTAGSEGAPAPSGGQAARPHAAPNPPACLDDLAGVTQALARLQYEKAQASVDCVGAGFSELSCAADVIDVSAQAAAIVERASGAAFDCGDSDMVCTQAAAAALKHMALAAVYGVNVVSDCRDASHAPWNCKDDAAEVVSRVQAAVRFAHTTQTVCGNSSLGAWASSLLGHSGKDGSLGSAVDLGRTAGLALQSLARAEAEGSDNMIEGEKITSSAVTALLDIGQGVDALASTWADWQPAPGPTFQRELGLYSARIVRALSAAVKALRLAPPNA